MYALGDLGAPAAKALGGVLSHRDAEVRVAALTALDLLGFEATAAADAVAGALEDPDEQVRSRAVGVLGRVATSPDAIQRLASRLDDEADAVRQSAIGALLRRPPDSVARGLEAHLENAARGESGPSVRLIDASSRVLEELGETGAVVVPALVESTLRLSEPPESVASALDAIGSDAVATLVGALADERATGARADALITGLGRAARGSVDELLEALESDAERVRAGVAAALGSLPLAADGVQDALRDRLRDEHASVRAAAARSLGTLGPRGGGVRRDIARLLDDRGPDGSGGRDVRHRAFGLGGVGNALKLLVTVLDDADARVRDPAVRALSALGPAAVSALPGLVDALEDPMPAVRAAAAEAIGGMGDGARPAVPALVRRLASDDETGVTAALLGASERLGEIAASAVPAVASWVDRGEPEIQERAIAALSKIGRGDADARDSLERAACEASNELRIAAGKALAKVVDDPETIVPVISAWLSDRDSTMRRSAMEILGDLGPAASAAAPRLMPLLEERYERVLAFQTLKRIEPRSPDVLREALEHDHRFVRVFACEAIARLGADGVKLLDDLRRVRDEDGDVRVRKSASEAIEAIEAAKDRSSDERHADEAAEEAAEEDGASSNEGQRDGDDSEAPADA